MKILDGRLSETLQILLESTGTFTQCKELMDVIMREGWFRKEGRTLHVDMKFARNCMCHLPGRYELIESMVRDLKKFFDVDEIIFHHAGILAENATVVEVEPGTWGRFSNYPVSNPRLGGPCGIHPVIKGLGMRWDFIGKNTTEA